MSDTPEKKSPLKEITQPFVDLIRAPRALWGINVAYVLEGLAYFGVLNYLAMYFNNYVGFDDVWAGVMVGVLTWGITLAMFFLGRVADLKGVRFALLAAFVLMIAGRFLLSSAPIVDSSHVAIKQNEVAPADPVFLFTDAQPLAAEPAMEASGARAPGGTDTIATEPDAGVLPPAVSVDEAAEPDQAVGVARGDSETAGDSKDKWKLPEAFGSTTHVMAMLGILLVVVGYGMYQPGAYAAVRKFTTPKTAPMGFAMLYALMNLGIVLTAGFGPIRNALGIDGAYWVFVILTVVALASTAMLLSRKTVEQATAAAKAGRQQAEGSDSAETDTEPQASASQPLPDDPPMKKGLLGRLGDYFVHHPLGDPKFAFFIFCLIPVQTLFAHQWLTMPMYVERAYAESFPWISKYFETALALNPLLVFIFVPVITAITQKAKVYNMMILGTFVMAAPTFLLTLGASPWTLFSYIVLMTLGESMWQPRFLQYAAEIAPEGRTGEYMGVAQLPWFLTKMLVPLYSGWFLANYVPKEGTTNSEFMWLIYGLIAVSSTVMLIFARGWIGKDFKTKHAG